MRTKLKSIRKYFFPNNSTSPRRAAAFRVGLRAGYWLEWKGNKDVLKHEQAIIRFYHKEHGDEFANEIQQQYVTLKCN